MWTAQSAAASRAAAAAVAAAAVPRPVAGAAVAAMGAALPSAGLPTVLSNTRLTFLEVCRNPRLEAAFYAAKKTLQERGLPSKEGAVFHGTTNPANIRLIQRDGFKIGGLAGHPIVNGAALGHGIYTGVSADLSHGYSGGHKFMLMLRVLPGAQSPVKLTLADCSLDDRVARTGRYQSFVSSFGTGRALILASPVLALPQYVVYWE